MTIAKILLTLMLALATSLPAQAGGNRGGYHGHRHHGGSRVVVGVNFGYPGYWGGYYPWYGVGYGYPYYPYYPYYPAYYPGPVVVQQQPTTYIEQPAPQAQQQAPTGYWYYCADQGAYYPYINECPAGWQRVAPRPSN